MFMMRFDMRAPGFGAPACDLYRCAIEMVEWADDKGCAFVAVSEHHASPDGYLPSPLVLASAMAARTRHVHFVVAATLLPLHDPVRLAEDMVVLDHVSGGRVSYVIGLGYRPEEYAMFGVPMDARAAVMERKLAALLEALRGEPFEYDGRRVHVTPAPATPGGPRVAYGGGSPAAARRAARFGLDFFAQTDGDDLERAYREEAARCGREPGTCMLPDPREPVIVFVADDVDAAWDELGPHLLHDAITYAAWNEGDTRIASISRGTTVEELRAENGAHRVMSVADAVAHVRRTGLLPLHPLCGGLPPEVAWPYLRRVVTDVLPAVAAG
ncbi:MAG: hypothetical protein KatS3mg009_1435 [Acidimicrobiia bacterium]|nr:MAG: hypothetical protein KatS3mg009_1435 [Acidimicrobiia bacterium]